MADPHTDQIKSLHFSSPYKYYYFSNTVTAPASKDNTPLKSHW